MLKKIILLSLLIIISGCSYQPASLFTKGTLDKKVYVNVSINPIDPENTVILKDTVYQVLNKKFGSNIVEKNIADTILDINFENVTFSNLQYDTEGFISIKQAKVKLTAILFIKNTQKEIKLKAEGFYDFSVSSDTLTDTQRFLAIKTASSKALDSILSKISMLGIDGVSSK
jgi:hypothetical protein